MLVYRAALSFSLLLLLPALSLSLSLSVDQFVVPASLLASQARQP
jgi:hypothetical protein